MVSLDTDDVFDYIDPGTFIDRYVERFIHRLDPESATTYEFDQMFLAQDGDGDVPDEITWGATREFSKHFALLSELPDDSETLREIQTHLQRLNMTPTEETINAFLTYLKDHYSSLTRVPENALIEIPDPTASKIGDYPVVDLILYAYPDEPVTKTIEATLHDASFAVDDPDDVFDHVNRKIPSGDVERFSDEVFQATVEEFRSELTRNLLEELNREMLEAAGYTELKKESVPEHVSRLKGGQPASYWQKESWRVDGIDATTGFARIWLLEDESGGVIEPSSGDFDPEDAIAGIKDELR